MRPVLSLIVLPALLASGLALAAPPAADVLPLPVTETTLANGLRVIVVPTGFPNLVSIQIPVQTGSRNEVEPGKSGFAHFFEHMMFRGTPTFPPARYQAVLTQAGARQNAYTTDDYTNYHTTFAKEDLETMLRVEADRFQHLAYSEEAFKTESRAVLGEYNKNSANPFSKLYEALRDTAYDRHPYKHTTMGFLRDIEDMPHQYAYSRQFFDRWYRPEHTALIVAGDVDAKSVLPLVEKYWGGWQRGSHVADIPEEPAPTAARQVHVPWPAATAPWVAVAFHGPAFDTLGKDHAAIATLMRLAFGPASDLHRRLVQDEQKVDSIWQWQSGGADPGLGMVVARVKRVGDVAAVRDEILKTLARVRSLPFTEAQVAEALSSAKYGLVSELDNTEAIAATVAGYVHYERRFDTLNAYFRVADTLTPEDLRQAAQRYFRDERLVLATLSHEALPEGAAALPPLASLAPPAATPTALPTTVLRTALPQVRFKLLFTAGSANDPPGKEGLAALTAAMVTQAGSEAMRFADIQQAFFPIAARFDAQVDKEMTSFTGSVHRDHWAGFTRLSLPMLLTPGFREEDFARLKDAQRIALVQDLRANNDEELAKERLQARVFAGTPYGHPVLGSVRALASITLDDVRDFWRRAYTQRALRIAVGGDASEAQVAALQSALAQLPAGAGLPAVARPAGRVPSGIEVEIIEKDTRATAISFGFPIEVTRAHPDFAALWLAKAWLGEHRVSSGRLYQRIRELRGLNYGDYAYIEAFPRGMDQFFPSPNLGRRAQLFEIWIRPVLPDNAHMALRLAVHELAALVENGIDEADFQAQRDYLMKNVFLATATQDQQLGYALDSQWYGTPEYTAWMRDALRRLTRDEVNAAVRRHLSAKRLSVVMVTKDAAALKAQLVGDGLSTVRYEAAPSAELSAEDAVIGRLKLGIRPQAVQVTPVDQVFGQ